VVGVRRTSSRRTRSSLDSASISTCLTPSTMVATSPRICLVARHGAQNAEENWTSVARPPSSAPRSPAVRFSARPFGRPSGPVRPASSPDPSARAGLATTFPFRARHHNPAAVASTSAPAAASTPKVTLAEQHPNASHSRHAFPAQLRGTTSSAASCRHPADGVRAPSAGPDGAQTGGGRPERRRL
jgi:hypothetical protein